MINHAHALRLLFLSLLTFSSSLNSVFAWLSFCSRFLFCSIVLFARKNGFSRPLRKRNEFLVVSVRDDNVFFIGLFFSVSHHN